MRAAPIAEADIHPHGSKKDGGEKEPGCVVVDQFVCRGPGVRGGEVQGWGEEQEAAAPDEEPDQPVYPANVGSHDMIHPHILGWQRPLNAPVQRRAAQRTLRCNRCAL
jgi:hypothetical protein